MASDYQVKLETVLDPPHLPASVVKGGKLEISWGCISFGYFITEDEIQVFCDKLQQELCTGTKEDNRPYIRTLLHGPMGRTFFDFLYDIKKEISDNNEMNPTRKNLELLICVVPDKIDQSSAHDKISSLCHEVGIVVKFLSVTVLKKMIDASGERVKSLAKSIKYEIESRKSIFSKRLNKEPSSYPNEKSTIIFGHDVIYHRKYRVSIAAIVASMDWPIATKFKGAVSLQDPREQKQKCVEMIKKLLLSFSECTNKLPETIIFFRDGVGEEKFHQVSLQEIDAIRMACISIGAKYTPRITFIMVKNYHPTECETDSYTCTDVGLKHTLRSTHYLVLHDENDYTLDNVKSLTNYLSYSCSSFVSVVSPVYFAHYVAFRAFHYMDSTPYICVDDGKPVLKLNHRATDDLIFYM